MNSWVRAETSSIMSWYRGELPRASPSDFGLKTGMAKFNLGEGLQTGGQDSFFHGGGRLHMHIDFLLIIALFMIEEERYIKVQEPEQGTISNGSNNKGIKVDNPVVGGTDMVNLASAANGFSSNFSLAVHLTHGGRPG
ncbi:hypothetical protein COLO4_15147 [Corchorus olitorius]|uniref:Uncharacterized protein n=1 Tax=Corchorus olitorius TaxID=93759 RepID=A0A1R3JPE4_9ROSI|nr:hypothetical protein COLO4_15147 [Corchorus olitorius]